MQVATVRFDAILFQLKQSLPQLKDPLKKEATELFGEIRSIITSGKKVGPGLNGILGKIFNFRVKVTKRLLIDGDPVDMLHAVASQIEELREKPRLEVLVENILFALRCNRRVLESLMGRNEVRTGEIPQRSEIAYEELLNEIRLNAGDRVAQRIETFINASLRIEFVLLAASIVRDEQLNISMKVINELASLVADAAQEYSAMAIELEIVRLPTTRRTIPQFTLDDDFIREQKELAELGIDDYAANLLNE